MATTPSHFKYQCRICQKTLSCPLSPGPSTGAKAVESHGNRA